MTTPAKNVQLAITTENDPRWTSVTMRDSKADGAFYFSVKTTGVYCRPSCAARRAKPENVAFHLSRQDAEAAGFRPCRRCRPDQLSSAEVHARQIVAACRRIERAIENVEEAPRLDRLAQCAGMSPFHFHRLFKAATGLTPKQYAAAQRSHRLREALAHRRTVTEAMYQAGYNSSGRFYEDANRTLGMAPARYRAGGARTDICFAVRACSLGATLVAQGDRGICAILLGADAAALKRELQDRFTQGRLIGGDAAFQRRVARVVEWVEAPTLELDLPFDIRGTAFQQRVWQALRKIPAGTTASYAEIARRIGAPRAARAVARACGANPLAVAIPCHRVVRADGAVPGYRWGVERKRALLKREAQARVAVAGGLPQGGE